jgi:hypothetical protein
MTSAVVRMSPRSATAFFCATAGPRRATLAPVAATFTRWPLPRPPPHTWPSRVVHRLFVAPGEFLEGGDDPTQGNRPLGLWQLRVRHLGPEVKEYLQGVRHSASPDLGRVSRADEVPACRPGRGGSPHSAMCSGRTPSDSWPGRATPPRAGATGASGSHTSDPSPMLALDEEGYEGGEQTQRSQEHCLRDVQGPQRHPPAQAPPLLLSSGASDPPAPRRLNILYQCYLISFYLVYPAIRESLFHADVRVQSRCPGSLDPDWLGFPGVRPAPIYRDILYRHPTPGPWPLTITVSCFSLSTVSGWSVL